MTFRPLSCGNVVLYPVGLLSTSLYGYIPISTWGQLKHSSEDHLGVFEMLRLERRGNRKKENEEKKWASNGQRDHWKRKEKSQEKRMKWKARATSTHEMDFSFLGLVSCMCTLSSHDIIFLYKVKIVASTSDGEQWQPREAHTHSCWETVE